MPSSYAGSAFIYGTRSTDAIVCSLVYCTVLQKKKCAGVYRTSVYLTVFFGQSDRSWPTFPKPEYVLPAVEWSHCSCSYSTTERIQKSSSCSSIHIRYIVARFHFISSESGSIDSQTSTFK